MKLADLTVNERILLHLRDFTSEFTGATAPFEQTQEGISKGVDVRINHVPRAIKKLKESGYVDEFLAHVHGLGRKRKVYMLTDTGRMLSDEILNKLMDEDVTIRRENGDEERTQIRNVPLTITTSASMSQIVLHTFSHGLVLELKLNRKLDDGPEYISNLVDIPAPELFFGREEEMEGLAEFLDGENRIFLMSGMRGIGKTSLVRQAMSVVEGQMNIFWFNANEWDTARSFFEKLSQLLARLGKTSLSRHLVTARELDVNMAYKAFIEDIREIEAVIIFDNAFNLQTELRHALGIICDNIEDMEATKLIITTRDDSLHNICGVPLRKSISRSIRLRGLEKEDAYEMMEAIGIEDSHKGQIFGISDGHPLVLEMVNSMDVDKLIDTDGLTREELLVVKCLKAYDAIFE